MEKLLAENANCVDCDSQTLEGVNMQLGVFLCELCASVHSKLLKMPVRKISDSFMEEEINFLSREGNQKINSVLMKNINPWTVIIKNFNCW